MLTGPQRKFCEGIVAGLNGTEAYAAAYPRGKRTARNAAPRLLAKVVVKAEIERLRAKADAKAGSAVLTLAEKRMKLAGIVRASNGLSGDGDKVETRDKLAAIKLDNDLAGEGSEAGANDELAGLLARVCAQPKL